MFIQTGRQLIRPAGEEIRPYTDKQVGRQTGKRLKKTGGLRNTHANRQVDRQADR